MKTGQRVIKPNYLHCTASIHFNQCIYVTYVKLRYTHCSFTGWRRRRVQWCLWVLGVIRSQRGIRPHCLQRFLLTDSISEDDVSELKLTFCLGGARAHRHTKTQSDTNTRAHNIYKYGLAVLSVFCCVINTGQKWSKNTNKGSLTQLSSTGGRI